MNCVLMIDEKILHVFCFKHEIVVIYDILSLIIEHIPSLEIDRLN